MMCNACDVNNCALWHQWWSRLVGDYQALYRQLETVESSIPSVGLVEETEDRLSDRIALYQVKLHHVQRSLNQTWLYFTSSTTPSIIYIIT